MDELDESNLGSQSVAIDQHGTFDIVRLDDEKIDSRVTCIKIDVEGMELDVLRGAESLIRRDRPLLYVECRDSEEFDAVEDWLGGMSYGLADTFNATPTHLFRPGGAKDQQKVEALRRNAHVRYQLEARYQRMKEFLRAANARTDAAREQTSADFPRTGDSRPCSSRAPTLPGSNFGRFPSSWNSRPCSSRAPTPPSSESVMRLSCIAASATSCVNVWRRCAPTCARNTPNCPPLRKDSAAQLSRLEAEHRRNVTRLRRRLTQLENSRSVRLSRAVRASKKNPQGIARLALESLRDHPRRADHDHV